MAILINTLHLVHQCQLKLEVFRNLFMLTRTQESVTLLNKKM